MEVLRKDGGVGYENGIRRGDKIGKKANTKSRSLGKKVNELFVESIEQRKYFAENQDDSYP